jgi:superfamily II DNA or RNA helicase/cell shape-determining protein MreC
MRLSRKNINEGYLHNHKDIGIDIVQIENDKCSIVQCKNGYNNGLCIDDISGIMMRCAFNRDVNTFIYYTSFLSRNILYTANISSYVVQIDCSNRIDHTLFETSETSNNKIYFVKLPYENGNLDNLDNPDKEDVKTEIVPYSYQTEAVNKFKEHYDTNNRGILSLPCGCGKTYTGYLISNNYKHIIIISPLREFASQNLNRFIEYGYDKKNTLLVDTDGNRDINSIKEFIKEHNNLVISCTYNSMDLISECLDMFKDALFIIDEFHNLSKANISDDENNIFKLLISEHKILFMSATPRIYDIEYDENEWLDTEYLLGKVVYQMKFSDAISNNYITDYKIWLPSIHENNEELDKELSIYNIDNQIKNRCKFLYSCIANNGSRKCIVYCKDTADMNAMMEGMKTLNDFYIMDIDMYSISCENSERERKNVLQSFTNNNEKIQLLFNIKILNECIDIPACDSIYIGYAPKNKITTIQRISRAIRTDENNPYKIANVYIWCEAYEEILETLSSIKEYDIMFNSKIKINAVDFYNINEDNVIKLVENDEILLSNYIIGIKEFKQYSWEEKLKLVKSYIESNDKLPSKRDKNKDIKQLGSWISNQKTTYSKQERIMKQENIRNKWEDFINTFSHLFMSNEEIWNDTLEKTKLYIETNDKLPSSSDKNKDIKQIGIWISRQKATYSKKEQNMKEENIRNKWEDFMNTYPHLFMSNDEMWNDTLEKLRLYIETNDKLPSAKDKNKEIKQLGCWILTQKATYSKKEQIMKEESIRNKWEDFINTFSHLFMSNEEIWNDTLEKLRLYIETNNKLPSLTDKNKEIKQLGNWISTQKATYSKKEYIMKEENIRNKWEDFINTHSRLFMSNEEIWDNTLKKLRLYIETNNKLPSAKDKNKDIKQLGMWISTQKTHYNKKEYIMKEENIRNKWEDFISTYSHLFMSNEEMWNDRLEKIKSYIDTNDELPSSNDKNKDIKELGRWISHQKKNYSKKEQIMKQENIRNIWEDFINTHSRLFMSNEEIWDNTLEKIKSYIETNNKLPSSHDKNKDIKQLASWISNQKTHYSKKEYIMKEENIRNKWKDFINTYAHLFMSNEEMWNDTLKKVKLYIETNNKLPSSSNDKNKDIKQLGCWILTQKTTYSKKECIMKEENIRNKWKDFINTYHHLFNRNL